MGWTTTAELKLTFMSSSSSSLSTTFFFLLNVPFLASSLTFLCCSMPEYQERDQYDAIFTDMVYNSRAWCFTYNVCFVRAR